MESKVQESKRLMKELEKEIEDNKTK